MILEHLAKAERHVRDGALLLQEQREIMQGMLLRGEDVTLARELMAESERTQALHLADRDRLRKALAQASRIDSPNPISPLVASPVAQESERLPTRAPKQHDTSGETGK